MPLTRLRLANCLWPLVVLPFAACASVGSEIPAEQPFHVALIPLEEPLRLVDPEGASESEVRLAVDPARLSEELCRRLGSATFVRATLLAPPADVESAEFAAWDAERRDAYWIRCATGVDADLLLECDLAVAPGVVEQRNERFWLNLPLFLLGGPGCYFVGDRTYSADARLRGRVFELRALARGAATLDDGRSRLAQAEARAAEHDLDFLDRAAGVGQYAASLVVPAGLLAHDGPVVEATLAARTIDGLAAGLARELAAQAREIAAAERVAPFELEAECSFAPDGASIFVRGTVRLVSGDLDRMEGWTLRSGEFASSGEFGDGRVDEESSTRRDRVLRYEFTAVVPREGSSSHATVVLAAGGRMPVERSYTLRLANPSVDPGEAR